LAGGCVNFVDVYYAKFVFLLFFLGCFVVFQGGFMGGGVGPGGGGWGILGGEGGSITGRVGRGGCGGGGDSSFLFWPHDHHQKNPLVSSGPYINPPYILFFLHQTPWAPHPRGGWGGGGLGGGGGAMPLTGLGGGIRWGVVDP